MSITPEQSLQVGKILHPACKQWYYNEDTTDGVCIDCEEPSDEN